ncbi:MAG: MutS-related protein [Acidimicrobiales bacterium]
MEANMVPSILYPESPGEVPAPLKPDERERLAGDLNLDQVFEAVNSGREDLDLLPLFYSPLTSLDQVAYRHEVLADFERPPVMDVVKAFGQEMSHSRVILSTARSLHNRWQEKRLFVDAVSVYCKAVSGLATGLSELRPSSRGLQALTGYVCTYQSSPGFQELVDGGQEVVRALKAVRYGLHIRPPRVTVLEYQGEPDYAKEVEEFFAKFREGAVKDFTAKLADPLDMNQVDGRVLDLIARLNPGPFERLDRYFERHQGFQDPVVTSFERDSQFYLSYLEYIGPLRAGGLGLCYPRLFSATGQARLHGLFDLALAAKLSERSPDGAGTAANGPERSRRVSDGAGVVTNDLELRPGERIVVVTGPNSGGKTTYARAMGQVHYLASLGLPVPARDANLVLADAVFTSFEQTEQLDKARSHLEDELIRLHEVVERASARTVVIMNESFSSTTLRDAAVLGKAVLNQLLACGALCLFVTFVDELAAANDATVSVAATVDPADPTVRTYNFVRKPPEGRAYAAALAERYGLNYRAVEEQMTA